jgi:hypothetical protein
MQFDSAKPDELLLIVACVGLRTVNAARAARAACRKQLGRPTSPTEPRGVRRSGSVLDSVASSAPAEGESLPRQTRSANARVDVAAARGRRGPVEHVASSIAPIFASSIRW